MLKGFSFDLTFDEAVEYFSKKGLKISYSYKDLWAGVHNKSFTVAKIMRSDLLNDLQDSLINAMKEGKGFKEWKSNIKGTLKKYGWWGKVDALNPKTGETKEIHVGSRRLKTIYETNVRMAYHNVRYKQASDYEDAVYWRYNSRLLENSRDSHRKMHGIVMHRDHSFWDKNMPMCDYNCACFLTFHTKDECDENGWSVQTMIFPNIAKNGFDYDKRHNVWSGSSLSKIDIDDSLEELPTLKEDKKYVNFSDEELKQKFFKSLGIGKEGGLFIDKIGDALHVNDELFKTGAGLSKIKKRDRHLFLTYFADLIKNPDEIYLELEYLRKADERYTYPNHRMVKKFFKYFKNDKGKKRALIAIFTYFKDKTQGVTLHYIDTADSVEKKRIEKLIYKRE
ncbi:MAG: phage minor head protein [Campylobacteraceae bacterium]